MNTASAKLCCWLCGASLVALAAPVYAQVNPSPPLVAQDNADPSSEGIGDIIVTAQKRSESINKVGISITAATGDALQQRGINDTADLVKIVPGFNFTQSAYAAPVYTLRGIGFYETSLGAAPTVSVYTDEVPLPLPLMTLGATLDLDRVEVLKGPQGTLFGQNATGGAINYIAAKPTSSFQSGADLSYSWFNDFDGRAYISGPLADTLNARLAVRYEHADDWQKSYTRNDSIGKTDILIGRLLMTWKPTDRLSVNFNVNGWRDKSDNQAAQLIALTGAATPATVRAYPRPPAGSIRAADWDADQPFSRNSSFWQASVRMDYELDERATLTSITAYDQLRRRSVVDADGTALQNYTVATLGKTRDISQELRIAGSIDRFQYVVGGNYAYDYIHDEGNPLTALSGFPFKGARATSTQRVNTYAVFGNLDYALTDTLKLQGGIRYTDQHRHFDGCTYDNGDGTLARVLSGVASARTGRTITILPGGCGTLGVDFVPAVVRDKLNEDNVAWRAGVNWQITPRALLYATVSKGYKSGAFPTAGALYSVQLRPATQESVQAYEAGFKVSAFNGTLQLNSAAFYYDYSDKQLRGRIVDLVIGPQNALINVPKSRISGAEMQLTWQPIRGLVVNTGGTYIGSRILDNFTNYNALTQLQNFNGQRFPLAPRWQFVGDAQYDFTLSSTLGAFAGASATNQSATNGGLGDLALFSLPAYTLVDIRLGLKMSNDRWRISAFVRNLLSEKYFTLVTQPGPDAVIGYTGKPRTFGVTLSYRN